MTALLAALLIMWVPDVSTVTPLERKEIEPTPSGTTTGIPVLMYHHVSDPVNGYYGVSTNRLLSDLEQLDAAGYYLITSEDLENSLMQVPAGRRPLILTFDDGWEDNFSYIIDGDDVRLDPNCVLALLEDFCDEHPDFGRGVTFFISWDKVPFGQEVFVAEKLNLLLDMGYSVGNHTRRHDHLDRISWDRWHLAVVGALDRFHRRLGLRTGMVSTIGYPGGRFPEGVGAEEFLSELSFQGQQAVTVGFLADGSISSFGRLLDSPEGWFRIGRLDMSQYSVPRVLGWRNLMTASEARTSLHDPLPWRMPIYEQRFR